MDNFDEKWPDWDELGKKFRKSVRPFFKSLFISDFFNWMPAVPFVGRLFNPFLHEEEDAFYLKIPLPGIPKNHVEIRKNEEFITVRAMREGEPVEKEFRIPRGVIRSQIKAKYQNGLLQVRMPKGKPDSQLEID